MLRSTAPPRYSASSAGASVQPLRAPAQSLHGEKQQARQHDQQRAGRCNGEADVFVDAGNIWRGSAV